MLARFRHGKKAEAEQAAGCFWIEGDECHHLTLVVHPPPLIRAGASTEVDFLHVIDIDYVAHHAVATDGAGRVFFVFIDIVEFHN